MRRSAQTAGSWLRGQQTYTRHSGSARWCGPPPFFGHPLQPDASCQGMLQMLFEMQAYLAEIAGLEAVTLQPAAGAQGELTALLSYVRPWRGRFALAMTAAMISIVAVRRKSR